MDTLKEIKIQIPACKNRAKYKEQAKTDKTKKWVPAKSRKIITERNQRKLKKTLK